MAGADRRWQVRSFTACHLHAFPEGVVLLDTADKRTCYLPGVAGAVFSALSEAQQGLDETAILQTLRQPSSDSGSELSPTELSVALSALEAQRLISEVS